MADDLLNDLSMKPTRDDLAIRKKVQPKRGGHLHSDHLPSTAPATGSRNIFILLLLLVAVAAGAGGWLMWQEMEKLRVELGQSQKLLTQSQANMGSLKANLANQSENITKTGSQIEADLKHHLSEIRKLWDLSHKRNKPAINKNAKEISRLKSSVAKQKELVAKTTQVTAAAQQTLKEYESQLQEEQLQVSLVNTQLSELEAQLKEITAWNKSLKNMLATQAKAISSLQQQSDKGIQTRLDELSQRLDAVDVHRRQVNARLDQQGRNIRELYNKP